MGWCMMRQFIENSFLFGTNAPFVEDLYERYLSSPESISPEWRSFFDNLQQTIAISTKDRPHSLIIQSLVNPVTKIASIQNKSLTQPLSNQPYDETKERKQIAVLQLINMYRFLGVRCAKLDPLNHQPLLDVPELDPAFHGLTANDLDTNFNTGSLVGPEHAPLRTILQILQQTYCNTIGAEYMFITDLKQKRWIQSRLESTCAQPSYGNEYKKHILERLTAAEGLEKYLHTRYVGQKRFSGEGN